MTSVRRRRRHRGKKKNHIYILITVLAVICAGTAGITLAYLSGQSRLTNHFGIAEVSAEVEEDVFDSASGIKEGVSIKNTGTTSAYIRATVTIYWKDEDQNILWGTPEENVDYKILWNLGTNPGAGGWIKGADGYYYHTTPVEENTDTAELIQSCVEQNAAGHREEGKYLVVDIAAQAIQAEPAQAVLEAWDSAVTGVDDGGVLTVHTEDTGGGNG